MVEPTPTQRREELSRQKLPFSQTRKFAGNKLTWIENENKNRLNPRFLCCVFRPEQRGTRKLGWEKSLCCICALLQQKQTKTVLFWKSIFSNDDGEMEVRRQLRRFPLLHSGVYTSARAKGGGERPAQSSPLFGLQPTPVTSQQLRPSAVYPTNGWARSNSRTKRKHKKRAEWEGPDLAVRRWGGWCVGNRKLSSLSSSSSSLLLLFRFVLYFGSAPPTTKKKRNKTQREKMYKTVTFICPRTSWESFFYDAF